MTMGARLAVPTTAKRPELTLGVDVGGTKTLALAVDPLGHPMASARHRTDVTSTARLVAGIERTVRTVAQDLGLQPADIGIVGVGIPGRVNPRQGTVRHAVNLGLADEPLLIGPLLAEALGVPVHVENDVNAAALGAGLLLGRPDADLAYVSIGTGIAAGFVLGGRIRRGRRGLAGEIGHLTVDPHGERCECGRRGCLELVASGSSIARRWPVHDGRSAAEELFNAAADGDVRAIEVRDELAGHLAEAVLLLMLTMDVELVVLGGGVAEAGEPLLDAVRAAVRDRASAAVFLDDDDLAASVVLAPDAPVGAVGAALAARRQRADELSLDLAWAAGGAP
jgi:predicted NBD/HSP70 family sugar kinase